MNTVGIILLFISFFLIFAIVMANRATAPADTNVFKKALGIFRIFRIFPPIFQVALDAIRCIVAFILLGGATWLAFVIFQQLGIASLAINYW